MFKMSLLATTALLVVASVSCVTARPTITAGSQLRDSVANRDTNDEFLCTFGDYSVSYYFHSSSSDDSTWTHEAVPITGKGKVVKNIIVREAREKSTASPEFSAGIYSNTASGLPGRLIVGGTGQAPRTCQQVTIPIAPTKLKARTTYWIEETVPKPSLNQHLSGLNEAFWATNPKSMRKAYVQSHYSTSSGNKSSTTPWMMQSGGVYGRVK
jgi:hypothetical protein